MIPAAMRTMPRFLQATIPLFTVLLLAGSARPDDDEKPQRVSAAPLENFDIRNMEGWIVYISRRDLADQPDGMKAVLDHLRSQLYQTRITLPAAAVAIMQERVPLWVEWDTGPGTACHPSHRWLLRRGYPSPEGLTTLVSFSRAKGFCRSALHQPWVACHELAHGYDYLYLGGGRHYSNRRLKEAYERLQKSGIYDSVLCRYSSATKHYALSNPMEYLAESTEAYFGANDFYPFVRAELQQVDPEMFELLQDLWGVDVRRQNETTRSLAAVLDARPGSPEVQENADDKTVPQAKDYEQRSIEGWTVHVHPALVRQKAHGDALCRLLQHKLHLVRRYMPEGSLEKLQEVHLWLEENNRAVPYVAYHVASGKGDKAGAVEVGNPGAFVRWQGLQPFAILNQLARAHFDRNLSDADRKRIEEARCRAAESKQYDAVLRFDGQTVRHPALASAADFFAEMTEAYYGVNDHFPFIQFETVKHDAETCRLLTELWGGKAK